MNDRSFVKLFSSIVTSSMWNEDSNRRVVWITLLAIANSHGQIIATVEALARIANVELSVCKDAVKRFCEPDKASRTKTDDGRRLVEIDGGWQLINFELYRRMAGSDERKEYLSQYYKNKKVAKNSTSVHKCTQPYTVSSEAEAEAEAEHVHTPPVLPKTQYEAETPKAKGVCDLSPAARNGKPVRREDRDDALEPFKNELLSAYRRKPGARLTYAEESALMDLTRNNPRYFEEWRIILGFREKEPRYFPQSLQRLLSAWQETLDRANVWQPKEKKGPSIAEVDAARAMRTLDRMEEAERNQDKEPVHFDMSWIAQAKKLKD